MLVIYMDVLDQTTIFAKSSETKVEKNADRGQQTAKGNTARSTFGDVKPFRQIA